MRVSAPSAFAVLALIALAPPQSASAEPQKKLDNCQRTAGKESLKLLKATVKEIDKCLSKISIEVLKKGSSDSEKATKVCLSAFRKLGDTRTDDFNVPNKSLDAKFSLKLEKKCDAASVEDLINDIDIYDSSDITSVTGIYADNIGLWCHNYGTSGVIDDYNDWVECMQTSVTCAARQSVTLRYPRAVEWLNDVRGFVADITPPGGDPTRVTDAVAAIDAVLAAIDEDSGDDDPDTITCGAGATALTLATGHTVSQIAGDDGDLKRGAGMRYALNGDGTVTDLNTAMMWSLKTDDSGLHDKDDSFLWSDAAAESAWDWLEDVNTDALGGYSDWRLPNVRELESLTDIGAAGPMIPSDFANTISGPYWTSTTSATATSDAWSVDFSTGAVTPTGKDQAGYVRAIRGPIF
jgi:hypothetical protein